MTYNVVRARTLRAWRMSRGPRGQQRIIMQYDNELLRQRVLRIVETFRERTADEADPLSRERIREVIEQVVTEHEEERQRGS